MAYMREAARLEVLPCALHGRQLAAAGRAHQVAQKFTIVHATARLAQTMNSLSMSGNVKLCATGFPGIGVMVCRKIGRHGRPERKPAKKQQQRMAVSDHRRHADTVMTPDCSPSPIFQRK